MMSWSKVVMNHTSFMLKMHSVAYRHSEHGFGGQVTLHLGSIMPDWHDLGYMLKVEVGEFGGGGGRPGYARNAGFFSICHHPPARLDLSPSLIWPNSLPPYHTSLACFISQPNRP